MIPQRQGSRQFALLESNSNSIACASSTCKVAAIVGGKLGVAVSVGKGVNKGVDVLLLVARIETVEEGVTKLKLSLDCVQPETTSIISPKLFKRAALNIFIIIPDDLL